MGLAASQSEFLALTARKSDIGLELERLSNQKTSLTREMQALSREYQTALSTKVMKWSNNSGVTYTDLTYATLMQPGAANGNKPILLTDMSGRVVLDDKYAKFAEMISSDGSPGGDYESCRNDILTAFVNISSSQLDDSSSTSEEVAAKKEAADAAYKERSKYDPTTYSDDDFIKKFLSASTLGITQTVDKSNYSSYVNAIKNALTGKNYFSNEVTFSNLDSNMKEDVLFNDKVTSYDPDSFISLVAQSIKADLGGGFTMYVDSGKNGIYSQYAAADAVYQQALSEYNEAKGVHNQVFTATEDKQIAFYDQLFTAIAEQGWVNDSGVGDSDYLNQMLQNNVYYVTTMNANTSDNADTEYLYNMDIASNFSNIFLVNDSDVREEALVKYEYEKSIINAKESKVDTRMKNLETEQTAISKMLESVEKVKEENIERTFNTFT